MAEPVGHGRSTPVACTVVARNYLPAARVLARSYLEHHPDHRFVVAVIDDDHADQTSTDGFRVAGRTIFGIDTDDYLRMATAYSVTELATAVKPYLLRSLRTESDVVIYLDPDIQVCAPMPELVELAHVHHIVLTPHFLRPLPRDGKEPGEAVIMGTGMFNLGFLAVGPGSDEFLDFWARRLRQDAIIAPEAQLFTDQRWVDHVPSLFSHHVLRDPGFNVAYWNTHEREITRDAHGELAVAGHRLRFFHFSGYRPEMPWLLTYHCARRPRTLLSEHPELRAMCDGYGAALRRAGYAETLDATPYGFSSLADGTTLNSTMRRLFRAAWIESERDDAGIHGRFRESSPPHGFGPDGGVALRRWLCSPSTPAQASAGIGRLAMAVWESRPDLRAAFPQPCGAHAEDFRHWCRRSGGAEGVLPEWAWPDEPSPLSDPDDEFGVNIVGYLTAELGLGEMGRIVHDTIEAAGVAVASVVENRSLSNRTGLDAPKTLGHPRFPVSLLCVNADQTTVILENHPEAGHHRYRIGLWAWELEDFPQWLHGAFDQVDEVWTVSDFCRDAIARHSPVPVKTIPVPIRDPGQPAVRPRQAGQPARFLFAFDFNSIGQRKNPWGLVEAFQRAFDGRDDVRLVIKSINSELNPAAAERLRTVANADRRITLIERYLDMAELDALYAGSHCYVSLHRSEGFGLTVAEAMARGMPVISTDYSGTTEFLDEHSGWPVPHRMVEVGKGCYPYHADARWAEPDLDAAADAMRQVADDPEEAARRGRAAREHILRTRSIGAASTWMAEQLRAAYSAWRDRGRVAGEDAAEPLGPLRNARQALLWRAEVSSPSRNPLAPAMRKMVLRAVDHYDVHQRAVLGALTDGVEDTVTRLLARIEALEVQLSSLDNDKRLRAVEEAVDTVREQATSTELTLRGLDGIRTSLHGMQEAERQHLDELREHVDKGAGKTFDMFVERDHRADVVDRTLQQMSRDMRAMHRAAALRHAPVPAGAEVVLCDAGALLVPRDEVFLPWLTYHRSWEDAEAELMATLVGTGLFVDVGAHVGYHTLRLARDCPDLAGVVAVEANPDTATMLNRNIAVNLPAEVAGKVTVLPVAAWDRDTSVQLVHADVDNSGDYRARDGGTAGYTVPAVRLDGLPDVAEHRVTLVKVDLQGRDHRALTGLTGVLERDHPQVVCEFSPADIEGLGDAPAQVLRGYRELGYQPIPLGENGPLAADHADEELIRLATVAQEGFVTLWLRPRLRPIVDE